MVKNTFISRNNGYISTLFSLKNLNMKKQECLWDIPAAGKEFKPSHLSDKMIVLVIVICLILFSG